MARELAIKKYVQKLNGCLAGLPDRLRLVLELRTGVDVSRELQPTAVAAYLNVPLRNVGELETSALRRLKGLAESSVCGQSSQTSSAVFLSSEFGGPLSTAGLAASGVDAVRYEASPAQPLHKSSSSSSLWPGSGFLGIAPPLSIDSPLLWVFAALGAAFVVAFLFGDRLGPAFRYRLYRIGHRRPRSR